MTATQGSTAGAMLDGGTAEPFGVGLAGRLYRGWCYSARTAAGWSSLVARRAHNPKVVGSNPTPATKKVLVRRGLGRRGPFSFSGLLPDLLPDQTAWKRPGPKRPGPIRDKYGCPATSLGAGRHGIRGN